LKRNMACILKCRVLFGEKWFLEKFTEKTRWNDNKIIQCITLPTIPLPRTVSNVPDRLNILQCLSLSCTVSSPRFSRRMQYLHCKMRRPWNMNLSKNCEVKLSVCPVSGKGPWVGTLPWRVATFYALIGSNYTSSAMFSPSPVR
jgi:hypothetical protein